MRFWGGRQNIALSMLHAQKGDDWARMGGGSAIPCPDRHRIPAPLASSSLLRRNIFNSLTMRLDFVVGEGHCTRIVDGGRFATDSPGRSDHRPPHNVSGPRCAIAIRPSTIFFQKPNDLAALGLLGATRK